MSNRESIFHSFLQTFRRFLKRWYHEYISFTKNSMGMRRTKDDWVAPPKEERVAKKQEENRVQQNPLTVNEELSIGEMTQTLPKVDMHGEFSAAVPRLVDDLLAENPNVVVRIITGKGSGVLMTEVMKYLKMLQNRRNSPILGFRSESGSHGASFVVRVK